MTAWGRPNPATLSEHDLLTIPEAAEALGKITPRTVYRLINRGQLASLKHAGRTYIARDQIGEYFQRLAAKGDAERARLEKLQRAAARR